MPRCLGVLHIASEALLYCPKISTTDEDVEKVNLQITVAGYLMLVPFIKTGVSPHIL